MALILGFNSFGQTSSNKELEENINEVFESYAFYNRFIGSVLISKEDNIIYEKSFGHADAENLKNNTKNSIFSIASVTKSLTAAGIMKLVDQGELSLETPISTFFPNLPRASRARWSVKPYKPYCLIGAIYALKHLQNQAKQHKTV